MPPHARGLDRPTTRERPIFDAWPGLVERCEFARLGDYPTPIEPLTALLGDVPGAARTFVKRDDLSSEIYGGNKVRTLEALFGQALRDQVEVVFSTGAFGSNHAVATALHAPRLGLRAGALLFPQPASPAAVENARAIAVSASYVASVPHVALLPLGVVGVSRAHGGPRRCWIMPPGGATRRGSLGFVSAALELDQQVGAGLLPRPDEVLIAIGSTCSSAGLLLGLRVARRLSGVGGEPPRLVAVRVTPWPVTSKLRVVRFAWATARWLRALTGDGVFDVSLAELHRGLELEAGFLGAGYGKPTPAGLDAMRRLHPLTLDTTYSAKSAAALLARMQRDPGPVRVYWATKSSVAPPCDVRLAGVASGLAASSDAPARDVPASLARWLESAARDADAP